MLTVVGVAAYIVIKKTSQDGGSGSAGGAISAGAAAGLAGAAGSSTTRQLKVFCYFFFTATDHKVLV